MLKVKDLSKSFNDTKAVDGVGFGVNPGEIYALIGPNGSGKTTIIKIIAGLLRPSTGAVVVDGHDAVRDPREAKARVGYIPDEPAVWPSFTGLEYLHFTGALFGLSEEERTRRIPGLLDIFRLKGIENGYFEDYSRGNKQKFTILAALLHGPKLLLIDEPIVGLDPVSAEVAQERFVQFAQQGGAVLLVTHTLSVAERIANRIGVLQSGRLLASGTLSELKNRAQLDDNSSLEEAYIKLTEKE